MAAPIDLSQAPIPASRPRRSSGGGNGRGTGTKLDDFARKLMYLALIVGGLAIVYLFFGLYGGGWDKAEMSLLSHADRQRQMDNIALVFNVLRLCAFAGVVSLLICCLRDEGVGYVLLGFAAVFYAGIPFLTAQIYEWRGMQASNATRTVLSDFVGLTWLFAVPGAVWTLADFARRFQRASETAAIQRANLKYGSNVQKQPVAKQKQKFLGRCWEMAYCRDHIREHCPVYVKKTGPCWWHKEGCMCEEKIILQATIHKDWKQQAARADAAYNFGTDRSRLTPGAKRERCRNCIIYNEHQRQKYKALVTGVLVVVPVLLILNGSWLQTAVGFILTNLERVMNRFSFGGDGVSIANSQLSGPVEWILISSLGLIILAQVLRLIEYCCFKIKI